MRLSRIAHSSTAALAVALALTVSDCSGSATREAESQYAAGAPKKGKKHKQDDQQATFTAAAGTDDSACDPSLWKHVYNPARLKVLDQCQVVTGTIEEVGPDDDGDEHMLLRLDPGQPNLINKKNVKKRNGDLVIEVVCAHPPTLRKAVNACKGYSTPIRIPAKGARVRVSGSYVIDTHNGWAELHPVSRIDPAR